MTFGAGGAHFPQSRGGSGGGACLSHGGGSPPSWGQPGSLGGLSSGHQSPQPCHYREGAAEDKTPILWTGRRSRLGPSCPCAAVGTLFIQHPGKPRPRVGGVAQVSPLPGGEAGLGRGPFPVEAGISQAWEPAPRGGGRGPAWAARGQGREPAQAASLTASEAGLAPRHLAPPGEVPA